MFKLFGIGNGLYFDQDAGAGGGAAAGAKDTDDSSGANGGGDQTAADADKAGDDKDKDKGKQTQKVTFTPEQQAEVDRVVKERLEREKKKSEADAEKARKKAEEDALTKNKEFETLAETRQTKITEFEAQVAELAPFKDQAEKYKGAMEKILKAQVDKLPNTIKVLVEKMDPIEQMKYITEHAKELNIEVIGVPETETDESNHKLSKETEANAKKNNEALVKTFLSR